jgi:hypothetical protein
MVVAAFLGSRPMTGFLCSITAVQVQGGGGVRVTVVETGPGTGCMPGPATAPFALGRVPRVDGGPDTFDHQVATWCP